MIVDRILIAAALLGTVIIGERTYNLDANLAADELALVAVKARPPRFTFIAFPAFGTDTVCRERTEYLRVNQQQMVQELDWPNRVRFAKPWFTWPAIQIVREPSELVQR